MVTLALKWHVRESAAHDALDLFNHFLLQLILDLLFFDVDLWNWVRAHQLVHDSIWEHQVVLHIRCKSLSLDFLLIEWLLLIEWAHRCHTCHRLHSTLHTWLHRNLLTINILRLLHSWCAILILLQVLRWKTIFFCERPHTSGRRTHTTYSSLIAIGLVSPHHISTAHPRCNGCRCIFLPLLLILLVVSSRAWTNLLLELLLGLLELILLLCIHLSLVRNTWRSSRTSQTHLLKLIVDALRVINIWLQLLLVPLVRCVLKSSEGPITLRSRATFHAWTLILTKWSTLFLLRFQLFLDEGVDFIRLLLSGVDAYLCSWGGRPLHLLLSHCIVVSHILYVSIRNSLGNFSLLKII